LLSLSESEARTTIDCAELEVFPGLEFPMGRLMSGMIIIQLAGSLVGWTGFTQRRVVN
jgi:hypothetical protein